MLELGRYISEGIPRSRLGTTLSVRSGMCEYAKVSTLYERGDDRCEDEPSNMDTGVSTWYARTSYAKP